MIEYYLDPFIYAPIKKKASNTYNTVSGNPISISDGFPVNAKGLKVALEPIQDLHGYSNPWPAGGGKNILPSIGVNERFQNVDISYDADTEIFTLNGTTTDPGNVPLARIDPALLQWIVGNRYTISVSVVSGNFVLGGDSGITYAISIFNSSSSSYIRGGTTPTETSLDGYSGSGVAFGSTGNFQLMMQCWRAGTVFNNLKIRIQIESGNTATAWSPYSNICPISGRSQVTVERTDGDGQQSISLTIPLGQTVYGGTVDVINGVLTVDRAEVDLGTLSWSKSDNHFYTTDIKSEVKVPADNYTVANIICSQYIAASLSGVYSETTDRAVAIQTTPVASAGTVTVNDSQYASLTANQFKTAMSGVQLVYELATPITVTLTPQDLMMLLGDNVITSDGTITLDYYCDVTKYIAKKIAEVQALILS